MANQTCRALAKLYFLCSILAVVLAAPVTILHRSVRGSSSSSTPHVHSGLASRSFHRPGFTGRKHAAHMVKRASQWTVHAGDTADKIAAQVGIQFAQLALLNPTVHWSSLQIGSMLNIPLDAKCAGHTYTIVAGDTRDTIAVTNRISFAQLAACNRDVDWYDLRIGRDLLIPRSGMDTSQRPIPNIEQAEQDVNITAEDTAFPMVPVFTVDTANPSSRKEISSYLTAVENSSPPNVHISYTDKAPQVPEMRALRRQTSVSTTYTVKAGDTGYEIAGRLGITFDVLSQANPGVNWLNLQIGQSLNLPGSILSSTTTVMSTTLMTRPSQSSPTSSSSPTNPTSRMYVTYQGAINAATPPYPLMATWIPFAQLWTMNMANIGTTCVFASGSVAPNSASETAALRSAILKVSGSTGVDPSFILAIVLQESNGCVRVPTTSSWEGISNPGLMQSFNGRASCNSKGRVQSPCSDSLIQGMITEGVKGNQNVGILPALLLAAKQDGTQWPMTSSTNGNSQTNSKVVAKRPIDQAMLYYQAARIYNSGSLPANGDLSASTGSTRCYVSDVVNRLVGWTGTGTCALN